MDKASALEKIIQQRVKEYLECSDSESSATSSGDVRKIIESYQ